MSVEQLQSLLQYAADGMDDAEMEASLGREDYRILLRNHILILRSHCRWHRTMQPVFDRCVEYGIMREHEANVYETNTDEDERSLSSLVDTYRRKFGRDPFVDAAVARGTLKEGKEL